MMDGGILSESRKRLFSVPQGNPKVFVLNQSDSAKDGYAAGVLVVNKKSMFAHRYSDVVN